MPNLENERAARPRLAATINSPTSLPRTVFPKSLNYETPS
jgi:hypothetical protein